MPPRRAKAKESPPTKTPKTSKRGKKDVAEEDVQIEDIVVDDAISVPVETPVEIAKTSTETNNTPVAMEEEAKTRFLERLAEKDLGLSSLQLMIAKIFKLTHAMAQSTRKRFCAIRGLSRPGSGTWTPRCLPRVMLKKTRQQTNDWGFSSEPLRSSLARTNCGSLSLGFACLTCCLQKPQKTSQKKLGKKRNRQRNSLPWNASWKCSLGKLLCPCQIPNGSAQMLPLSRPSLCATNSLFSG